MKRKHDQIKTVIRDSLFAVTVDNLHSFITILMYSRIYIRNSECRLSWIKAVQNFIAKQTNEAVSLWTLVKQKNSYTCLITGKFQWGYQTRHKFEGDREWYERLMVLARWRKTLIKFILMGAMSFFWLQKLFATNGTLVPCKGKSELILLLKLGRACSPMSHQSCQIKVQPTVVLCHKLWQK